MSDKKVEIYLSSKILSVLCDNLWNTIQHYKAMICRLIVTLDVSEGGSKSIREKLDKAEKRFAVIVETAKELKVAITFSEFQFKFQLEDENYLKLKKELDELKWPEKEVK